MTYQQGGRVRYTAADVFDRLIRTGDIGVVEKEEDGWVHARWPRSGRHSVPAEHVEPVTD